MKNKLLTITLVLVVLLGIGLMLYKPVMQHFIIPKVHDHISEKTKKTPVSTYDKNNKDVNKALKDYYKKNKISYDGTKFSDQMANGAFKDGFNLNGKDSSYPHGLGKNGDGGSSGTGDSNGSSYEGLPNITFDYGQVKAVGHSDLSNINTHYDKRLLTGHIALPSLGVSMPVLEGVSNTNLYVGAGTLKPFQQMGKGNYALASHHMPDEYSNFSRIGQLQKGSMILLSDGHKVYEYRTSSVKNMPTRSSHVVDDVPGKKMVTLVTCYNTYGSADRNGNARIVVQGDFVKTHSMHSDYGQYFR